MKSNKNKRAELLKNPVPKSLEDKSMAEDIILNDFCNPASDNDFTGLIPTSPENKEQQDNYNKVYPTPKPVKPEKDTYGAPGTHSGV